MAEKLLTVVVPCFNSADYMGKCIRSLLQGGEKVEILIIDDGSDKDRTGEIADAYARRYPDIIRVIHQENAGHGGAINTGIANAKGLYFKVCDSDDYFNKKSYLKVLNLLEHLTEDGQEIDLLITNFVYDKQDVDKKRVMRYRAFFPNNTIFGWKDTRRLDIFHYARMHSLTYRTEILRESGLKLPENAFYVDKLYTFVPIPYVKKLYYMDVDLYRFFIGRDEQSVNEKVMIEKLDDLLLVTKKMIDYLTSQEEVTGRARDYMLHHLSAAMTISTVMCYQAHDITRLYDKELIWEKLKNKTSLEEFLLVRHSPAGVMMNLPLGPFGRRVSIYSYHIIQKVFGFK